MPFRDLREYIAKLEEEGEIQHIQEEVDWNLEVGAIIRRSNDLGAPAPLFENIKGYPGGFRMLGSPMGPSAQKGRFYARLAMTLGLPPETGAARLIEEVARAQYLEPVKPVLVSTGPCKENVHVGDEVNLLKFPAPFLHSGDGGRYIGTWDTIVTRDPDTGWVNWGTYRLMVHDKKTMGGLIIPSQHIGVLYYSRYEARNKPMPFAVVIGTDPLITLLASSTAPLGVSEADIVGAMRRQPVEVVKCETVDLEVPATSEIVIEGEVMPYERREEGPFGEYSGYQFPAHDAKPVYRVSAITHRNDPILTVASPGVPVEDDHIATSIPKAAFLLNDLRALGYPVKMVFIPLTGSGHVAVVSTENKFPNIAKRIACAVWATKGGPATPKIMVVDTDVDVTDMDQVFWAFSTRNHPDKGIFKVTDTSAAPLLGFLGPEEKKNMTTANVLFDCTWPKNWPADYVPKKVSFDCLWPKEIQEKVLTKWEKYGYKK